MPGSTRKLIVALLGVVSILLSTPRASALPAVQNVSTTAGHTTVTLWVLDSAIDGDTVSWCEIRVEVVTSGGNPLSTDDVVSLWVRELDGVLNELLWTTSFSPTSAEVTAGLVDRTFDCSTDFGTDLGPNFEIYTEAETNWDCCFLNDFALSLTRSVARQSDDGAEEDDTSSLATDLTSGTTAERICADEDWYAFNLTDPTAVRLAVDFDSSTGDLLGTLYNDNMTGIGSTSPSAHGATLETILGPGDYTFVLEPLQQTNPNFCDVTATLTPAACLPNDLDDQACGKCGQQWRTCGADGTWGGFGACAGEGPCTSGDTETQSCEDDTGTQARVCNTECTWAAWSPCETEPCTHGEEQSCYFGPAGTQGEGLCAAGTRTCVDTVWGACEGQTLPGTEVCDDNIDNDCDGQTDDEDDDCGAPCTHGDTRACYEGPAGTAGVGQCAEGTRLCISGTWGACPYQVLPHDEICDDGIDNDCDGTTDTEDDDCEPTPNPAAGDAGCACGSPGSKPSRLPFAPVLALLALALLTRRSRGARRR